VACVPGDDVTTRESDPPDAVLRYARHDEGVVDVHLPGGPGRPRPLVVNVHGGFWRQDHDRTHARPFANGLVAEGLVVAAPEYRRGPRAWPATSEDLVTVLSSLPGLLHGIGVETTTITLTGHSAGGQLVLWAANEVPLVDGRVHRVVALAPVGNLRKAVEHEMGAGAAVDFLGGTPEQLPEVYDAADPATRMRQRPGPDVVVLHGDRDDDVPVQSSRGLSARFPWLDYRELEGADHVDLIDPRSAAWPAVVAAIRGRQPDHPDETLEA
jgi:acetyl esterase/lipase